MKALRYLALLVLITAGRAADINIDKPISSVALKDGRILENLELVSFSANSVMAKWKGGRGTVRYELLPDELQKVVEARRPKKDEGRQQVAPGAGAEGSGDQLQVLDIALRKLDRVGSYVEFAWTVKVKNGTGTAQRIRPFIALYDAKGFELDKSSGDSQFIAPSKTITVSGKGLVKAHLWDQMKTYKAGIR